MSQEIERKYLVRLDVWKPTNAGVLYRQGYLSSVEERSVRVRIAGEQAYLTIKGPTYGMSPQQAMTTSGSQPLSLEAHSPPNAQTRRAMFDSLVHRQPLRRGLLAGDDNIDIVATPQAMIGYGEQTVGIRRQVDAHDLCLLVDDKMMKPGS